MLNRLISLLHTKPVVYDSNFFLESWFRGWVNLSAVLASLIKSEPKWRTIIDFGCGPGIMIDQMTDQGLNYSGCDYSAEARQLYLQHYGCYPERYLTTLDEAPIKNTDLLLAFDVLEHMRDDEIAGLLGKINAIPELLFNISRARGIPGHINIKSDQRWIEYMRNHGYLFEEERTNRLRQLYVEQRPGSPDQWNKNLFLFSRIGRDA